MSGHEIGRVIVAGIGVIALGGGWSGCGMVAKSGPRAEPARAVEAPELALEAGTFTVSVTDGLATVRANAAPLKDVLGEIGRQAAIDMVAIRLDPEEITMSLDEVPLEEAIPKLASGNSFWIHYETVESNSPEVYGVYVGENALFRAAMLARVRQFRKQQAKQAEAEAAGETPEASGGSAEPQEGKK